MARRHYWQFLVTDEGSPIENAGITISTAGSDNPVFVYTSEIGGSGTASTPQIVTSKKGYFEFWVGDTTETNGYPLSQKFKIAWFSAGVTAGYVDYVDVFSTSVAEVDETSDDDTKNKAVSNNQAKGWETHKNLVLYVDSVVTIHGMTAVDETDTNATKNKLISNSLGKKWDTHADAVIADSPHGITTVDEDDTNATKNKVVSNLLANNWKEHRTNVTLDEHTQYSLVDGSRTYTAGVGYDNGTIVDSITDDEFVTKAYVDTVVGVTHDQDLDTTDFVTFAGVTSTGNFTGNGQFITGITMTQLSDTTITGASNGQLLEYQSGFWINTTPAVINLDSISDVTITGASDDEVLTYSGGTWINAPIDLDVADLTDVTIAALATNHHIVWNGSFWGNTLNSLNNLSNVTITSVDTNHVLTWSGSTWINQASPATAFVPKLSPTVIKNGSFTTELIVVTGAPANSTVAINFWLKFSNDSTTYGCLHTPAATVTTSTQCNMNANGYDNASRKWETSGQIIAVCDGSSQIKVTKLAGSGTLYLSIAGWWA